MLNNVINVFVLLIIEIKNKFEKKSKFICVGKNYIVENVCVMIVNNI